jgi:hypothetical protein
MRFQRGLTTYVHLVARLTIFFNQTIDRVLTNVGQKKGKKRFCLENYRIAPLPGPYIQTA